MKKVKVTIIQEIEFNDDITDNDVKSCIGHCTDKGIHYGYEAYSEENGYNHIKTTCFKIENI